MKESHYYDNHMDRRLATWNDGNTIDDYRYGLVPGKPKLTTASFFQEKETEILLIFAGNDDFELFEDIRIYIERHGRPYNYLQSLERLNNDRHIYLDQKETDQVKKTEISDQAIVHKKSRDETRLQKLAEDRLPTLNEHSKDLEHINDMKSREFMMKNIVPHLSEGLIEVSKVAPIDPIDYLADYIFKKSNELHKTKAKN
jgi:adenylate kinase